MAEHADIRKKNRQLDPRVEELSAAIEKVLIESGYRGAIVTTTEDMTPEEEEMAIFEGYLREGFSIEEASRKAKQFFESVQSSKKLLNLSRQHKKGKNS